MRRRQQKGQDDLFKASAIFLVLIGWWLYSQGLLLPVLLSLGGLIVIVLVALSFIKQRRERVISACPSALPVLSASSDIEVECPQCKAILVAPAYMAGQPATCEACRNRVEIPKPVLKMPAATQFYFHKPLDRFSAALLKELEWKRFEHLVEGYFAKSGWVTRPNRIGADGGVDVHLIKPGQPGIAAVVQCKSWQAYDVGVKPIRELFGVMAADRVPEGFFVTTGEYTGEARSFSAGKPMTLIDGRDLMKRLESLPPEDQAYLFAKVTAGDYTTPTCPQCGRKMVRREAGKGRAVGSEFWGCPSYPRCHQTFQMKKDTE